MIKPLGVDCTVSDWADACLEAASVRTKRSDLWDSWCSWCSSRGTYEGPRTAFFDTIRAAGFGESKSVGVRFFDGLRIK
jgi:hypothetical protein